MSGLFGGSKSTSSQTSTPVDMTPEAFKALQPGLAAALANLFGGNVPAYTGSPGANLFASQPTVPNPAALAPGAGGPAVAGGTSAATSAAATGQPANLNAMSRNERFPLLELMAQLGLSPGGATSSAAASAGAGGAGAPASPVPPATIPNPNYQAPAGEAQLVAPMTADQNAILQQIVGAISAGSPNYAASQQMLGQTIAGQYLTPQSNPFLQATIEAAQRPLVQQFESSIVPQLLSRFTAAGQRTQGSSAFAREANTAASTQAKALGDVSTAISSENYQNERNRQIAATTQASQISTDELNRMVTGFEQAALPQLIKDLGIQRGLEQFNKRMEVLMEALRIAGGVAAPTVAQSTTGTSKSTDSTGAWPLVSKLVFGK